MIVKFSRFYLLNIQIYFYLSLFKQKLAMVNLSFLSLSLLLTYKLIFIPVFISYFCVSFLFYLSDRLGFSTRLGNTSIKPSLAFIINYANIDILFWLKKFILPAIVFVLKSTIIIFIIKSINYKIALTQDML